jgi:ABC-type glycerol-3-phosphate transport system substrate-binding protein
MQIFRPDPVNAFFDTAGITLFDKNTGEITADKSEVEEICRFVKLVYDNAEKSAALTQKFRNDFSGATASFSFFTENYAFLNDIRYYQSLFPAKAGSPMVAMPYHKLNDPQSLCASIVCFGGVNAKTKAPEQAFELLKFLLDYSVQTDWARGQLTYEYHAPVSLAVYQEAVEQLSINPGAGEVEITPLNRQNAELLMANTQRITDAVIANTALGVRLEEAFTPYFLEQDSFDNCYDVFLQELQQYLNK